MLLGPLLSIWAGNFLAVRSPVKAVQKQKQKQSRNCSEEKEGKKTTKPKKRLFQDLATIEAPKSLDVTVTRLHWQLLVDARYTTFGEASNCIAKLDGKKKTRIEHYQGKLPAFANQLRTSGAAGTVHIGHNDKAKDRGVTMLFIEYVTHHDHEVDCWHMYNPETKRVS